MASGRPAPFDYCVVDEAQDISVSQLRFVAALGHGRPEALFFAGDLGQRIFQQPFSWKALGVDVRGRSKTLRVNYRTSHQIRDLKGRVLDDKVAVLREHVSISTMHLAKGLEFRAVAVIACDDEVVPLQERIETVGDDADLQEIYDTERHLLYVACTRARDRLSITAVEPASEFLDDLAEKQLTVGETSQD
jgi:superfamily I DNA/RNA helicase